MELEGCIWPTCLDDSHLSATGFHHHASCEASQAKYKLLLAPLNHDFESPPTSASVHTHDCAAQLSAPNTSDWPCCRRYLFQCPRVIALLRSVKSASELIARQDIPAYPPIRVALTTT